MKESKEAGEKLDGLIKGEKGKKKEKKKGKEKSQSPKNKGEKTEKQKRLERFGWFALAISVLALFWFFVGSFAGKFWFKVFLSAIVSFVIGKKPKTWFWRILTGAAVFFVSMIYTGETTELFRYAILATGGSALLLFSLEEFVVKKNIYPRGMLPVFLATIVVCAGFLLGDLFSDHKKYVAEQIVSVSDLQKKTETEKQLTPKFSFSKKEIEIPEFLCPIPILEKEEKSIHELLQNWLPVKIRNNLPAEYWRANSVIRMALFILFLFAVHAVYIPVGSFEAAKDYWKWREEKKKGKGEPIGESRVSYWFIERAWEQLVNIIGKRRKK